MTKKQWGLSIVLIVIVIFGISSTVKYYEYGELPTMPKLSDFTLDWNKAVEYIPEVIEEIVKDDIQIAHELSRKLVEENLARLEELNEDLEMVVRSKQAFNEALEIAESTQERNQGFLDGFKIIDPRGYDLYWQIVDDQELLFDDESIEVTTR